MKKASSSLGFDRPGWVVRVVGFALRAAHPAYDEQLISRCLPQSGGRCA